MNGPASSTEVYPSTKIVTGVPSGGMFSTKPSNDRDWQPDWGVLAYANIAGSKVTVHAHGHDANQALAELETLINRKFDEE